MSIPRNVLIVAGEASGDAHAAQLIREVKANHPDVRFAGIGGEKMRESGVEILIDSSVMAVVGLFEVLAHFPTIYGALRRMRRELREQRPDLLILVDYPDFNLRLAKTAKELGIQVLYYISPQVWAWRQKRVKMIGERIDRMAVVFPFEVPFYRDAGIPVDFVGHPLSHEAKCPLTRDQAAEAFGLDTARKTIGLFPGSRRSEIGRLLPLLVASAKRLKQQHPELQFLLPIASTLSRELIEPHLDGLEVTLVEGRPYDVMRGCNAIVSASGTATLEIALIGTPLVVVYRIAPLSYRIMSRMIKVAHIALCNIVAGERMVVELIQDDATAEAVVAELDRLLHDEPYRQQQLATMATVKDRLGNADKSISTVACEMLNLDV